MSTVKDVTNYVESSSLPLQLPRFKTFLQEDGEDPDFDYAVAFAAAGKHLPGWRALKTSTARDYYAKLFNDWHNQNPTLNFPIDLHEEFKKLSLRALPLRCEPASMNAKFQSMQVNDTPTVITESDWMMREFAAFADPKPAPEDCSYIIDEAHRMRVEDLFTPEYPGPYVRDSSLEGVHAMVAKMAYHSKIAAFLAKWYKEVSDDDPRKQPALHYVATVNTKNDEGLVNLFKDFEGINPDRQLFIAQFVEATLHHFSESSYRDSAKPITLSTNQIEVIVRAFKQDYVDLGTLAAFKRHAEMIFACWSSTDYYSPYTSMVQVSMSGKTSMLMRLGSEKDYFVVYCCLRKSTFSGYPKRSLIADYLLAGKTTSHFVAYLSVCLEYLADHKSLTPAEFMRSLRDTPEPFWNEIKNRIHRKTEILEFTDQKLEQCIRESSTKYCKSRMLDLPAVVFGFDEAHELLEVSHGEPPESAPFYHLRRAMRCLPASRGEGNCRVLGVFTDTTSCLSNFSESPASSKDRSFRVGRTTSKLFPPFPYVVGVDANRDGQPQPTTTTSCLELAEQYGLPMWGAIAKAGGSRIVNCIELAKSKLVGGVDFNDWVKKIKGSVELEEALAILGVRTCIEISPQSQVASNLVASYMRVCHHISDDRHALITSYISDPTLAVAAAEIMNHQNVQLQYLLDPVTQALKSGVVEGGYRGELAARILLILAWDKGRQKACLKCGRNNYDGVLTLEQYLQAILAKGVFADLKRDLVQRNKTNLLRMKLRLLQFISITYKPMKKHLVDFFRRGLAVVCTRNQEGVDLLIPIFDGELDTEFDEQRFSYVLIQVKNLTAREKDKHYPASATSNLSPVAAGFEFTAEDYLAIYMSVTSINPYHEIQHFTVSCARSCAHSLHESFFQSSISLFGISPNIYGCITEDTAEILMRLANAWPDPLELTPDCEKKQLVKLMSPLVYSDDMDTEVVQLLATSVKKILSF